MKIETPALNVTELIDQRPLSRFQLTTIIFCGLIIVLDGFDAQCIGFLAPAMADTFHVPLKAFSPVFAASLIGLMISSMSLGPVADRWGRRWTVILSTITFAIFSILTGRAHSIHEATILRFLTGLGLGGSLPNAVALASEYSPKRLQQYFVTVLFCGMPLGALIGGLASSVMVPAWGWPSVFYLGGILPLMIAGLLIGYLPESVRFLAVRDHDSRKIAKIMMEVAPELGKAPPASLVFTDHRSEGAPVKQLFTNGRAAGTILLWIPFFMNLLILYFIISWLPALLRQAALPTATGIAAISAFSLGGFVACLVQGWFMSRFGGFSVLVAEFALSALLIGSLAFFRISYATLMPVTFLLGGVVQGAQGGLNALAATFYPTAARSTGIGWALGVGRIGSIVGPVLGGLLLALNWSTQQIFLAGAIPALCAVAALLAARFLAGSAGKYRAADAESAEST